MFDAVTSCRFGIARQKLLLILVLVCEFAATSRQTTDWASYLCLLESTGHCFGWVVNMTEMAFVSWLKWNNFYSRHYMDKTEKYNENHMPRKCLMIRRCEQQTGVQSCGFSFYCYVCLDILRVLITVTCVRSIRMHFVREPMSLVGDRGGCNRIWLYMSSLSFIFFSPW